MGFLKNHLSGEDTPQARRPDTLAGEAQQARTAGPHRRLPARASAPDDAQASPALLHGSQLGAPAGLPTSVPQGAHSAESCVDPNLAVG